MMEYLLSNFITDVDAVRKQGDVKLSDFEAPFKKFLESEDLFSAINAELTCASRDPLYVSYNLRGNSLIIHVGAGWTLVSRPVGVLKFLIPSHETLQWTFDRETLAPLQAISATAAGSELAFIAQVLGVLKNQSSVVQLTRLAKEHPQHNVRWEAVKAIGKINPTIGLEVIKQAAADKHPHVAAAAKRTLARYLTS